MDYKDRLFIIRNRLFEKRNIILTIVLTIIFLILFSCLTVIQFSIENKNEILNSEIGRTYLVYPDENQEEQIKNIAHIESITSIKYKDSKRFLTSTFDKENEKGILYIKALLKKEDIKIKKGTNLKNKNEIVCSDTFYPHEYDEKIFKNLYLPRSKFLNKSVEIASQNEEREGEKVTLHIVGTYKNKFMEEANTCYTDIETFDSITSKYSGWSGSYDEYGNLISKVPNEYDGYLLRVDSKKNVAKIEEELRKMKVEFGQSLILDTEFLNLLYSIPLFISIIIILFSLSIIYSFITKKINNRIHNIGILKAIGYEEKTICVLNIIENAFIIFISSFISILIYYIVLNNLKYTLLAEVTYNNYILNVPYVLILLSIILYCVIITKIVKSKFKKIFKLSIQQMLEK